MRTLYHFTLHAASRRVRIALGEKTLAFDVRLERFWESREELLALSPGGELPVLVEPDGYAFSDATAICELLEERYPAPALLGRDALARAEVRRLVGWFGGKLHREVTASLVEEKILKRLRGDGGPDSRAIRNGRSAMALHLDYIGWLTDRRRWLAGDHFSLADIAAAAELSTADYLGDVPWERFEPARDWYARVNSRPSVRPLLADSLPGAPPAPHYADLDF